MSLRKYKVWEAMYSKLFHLDAATTETVTDEKTYTAPHLKKLSQLALKRKHFESSHRTGFMLHMALTKHSAVWIATRISSQ